MSTERVRQASRGCASPRSSASNIASRAPYPQHAMAVHPGYPNDATAAGTRGAGACASATRTVSRPHRASLVLGQGACAERAYEGLAWLWARPETNIAVVAHGSRLPHTLPVRE